MGFRPYSLRRGGATFFFQKHQSLDKTLVQGRWHTQKSARIYLNEGLAVLAQMRLPSTDPKLKPWLTVYKNFLTAPVISTLEPPCGRAGGSGRNSRNVSKKPMKKHSRGKEAFFKFVTVSPHSFF